MTLVLFLKLALPLCAFALLAGFWYNLGRQAALYISRLIRL